jgi:ATPase subunit of ABC transporter with duplicated ATPase domains
MNRIVTKIAEIDGGEITTYSGNYDFYERERAVRERQPRGGVRAPAVDAAPRSSASSSASPRTPPRRRRCRAA